MLFNIQNKLYSINASRSCAISGNTCYYQYSVSAKQAHTATSIKNSAYE